MAFYLGLRLQWDMRHQPAKTKLSEISNHNIFKTYFTEKLLKSLADTLLNISFSNRVIFFVLKQLSVRNANFESDFR